jgi:ferredoxin
MKRKIIQIDEGKCNGCGECIPNCPEGALQIIEGKARLISDLFCDGLGACIGHCPQGAITIEERQAQEYDERKVIKNIVKQGKAVVEAHLAHLKEHKQEKYLKQALDFLKESKVKFDFALGHAASQAKFCACPGSRVMDLERNDKSGKPKPASEKSQMRSELGHWPVQLTLVPAFAPFLQNADILIAADCVAFTYASFHQDLLKGRALLIGCPKLDDVESYEEKLKDIINRNKIKSITYAHMEVPCCFGLVDIIKDAISDSKKDIPFKEIIISIKGEMKAQLSE